MKKECNDIETINFINIAQELRDKIPFLFRLLSTLSTSKLNSPEKIEATIPRLAMMYSMIMQSAFSELSLMQKLNSLLFMESVCDKQVYNYVNNVLSRLICIQFFICIIINTIYSSHLLHYLIHDCNNGRVVYVGLISML
jgi:hypothetical protein